eukprot:scaffold16685_cov68-Phaeocystis_antarctica.AAC.2
MAAARSRRARVSKLVTLHALTTSLHVTPFHERGLSPSGHHSCSAGLAARIARSTSSSWRCSESGIRSAVGSARAQGIWDSGSLAHPLPPKLAGGVRYRGQGQGVRVARAGVRREQGV